MKLSFTAFILFVLISAAGAEEFIIRPSVWGTQKWPGGYEIYNSRGFKIGEAKASNWGQDKWYGGYDVKIDDRFVTPRENKAILEMLKASNY